MVRTIETGPLAASLSVQLAGYIPAEKLATFDRHAAAINRCHIFGFITEQQYDKANRKLVKSIQSAANEFAKAYNK